MTDEPDEPDFIPVATERRRHDGWTPERQRAFLAHLDQFGGVGAAARAVGLSRASAYALRARPGAESFAAAWDRALENGRLRAYDEAVRRGLHGYTTPVMYRGKVVGQRRRFDNRLLFAACYAMPLSK